MQTRLTIKVDGRQWTGGEIEALEVVQELGAHTRLVLTLGGSVSGARTSATAWLGSEIAVRLEGYEDNGTLFADETLFTGEARRARQTHRGDGIPVIVIEALSHSHRLDHRNTRIFTDVSFDSVLGQLGATVEGVSGGAKGTFVQAGETDFDFLCALAYDHGCLVRTDGKRVVVREGFEATDLPLRLADRLLEWSAEVHPVNPGVKGGHYDVLKNADHLFNGVRASVEWTSGDVFVKTARQLSESAQGGGDPNLVLEPPRATTIEDARQAMEARSERLLGNAVRYVGRATDPRVRAGTTVAVAEGGFEELMPTGTYGVVKVTHRFTDQSYQNEFEATAWKHYTTRRFPERRVMHGVVAGLVTDIDDPVKVGRVRVQFRSFDDKFTTWWVRVAAPTAGSGRGIHFMPEVGDEVLVAFEWGDPERPVVIGALWNGKNLPPDHGGAPNTEKRIVTTRGNTILLHDEDGKERIEIFSAEGKCLLKLDNSAGPRLTIHSVGDLHLEAPNGRIQLTCRELVENVAENHYSTVGQHRHATIGQDDQTDVGMNRTEAVGMNDSLSVGMNYTLSAGGIAALAAGGKMGIDGGAMLGLDAGMIQMQMGAGKGPKAQKPKVTKAKEKEKETAWTSQAVPAKGTVQSTADAETPRRPGPQGS